MIVFKNVTKTYGETGTTVFKDFNMTVEDGEFILLTGQSGAGKSTLMKLLLKETDFDDGTIMVNDQSLKEIKGREIPYYRRKIGVVFQESHLIEDMTVYQNIEIARIITGGSHKENQQVIISLMKLLGISNLHKRYPRELSGGQQQKVCLARALVNYPYVLLADEPTGNLHPQVSAEIMKLFEVIHNQGTTVIVATHDRRASEGMDCREIKI